MNKIDFRKLFESALNEAVIVAEGQLHRAIARQLLIKLYGAGHGGDLMTPEQAADALYIGEDRFYRIIDVSVIAVDNTNTTVFVRASDHTPTSFEKTWNTPPGWGPFKQLIPNHIEVGV